jgi:hypothetical protein
MAKDETQPAGYGESKPEEVNSSGYSYPASHFEVPRSILEERGEVEPETAPKKATRRKS